MHSDEYIDDDAIGKPIAAIIISWTTSIINATSTYISMHQMSNAFLWLSFDIFDFNGHSFCVFFLFSRFRALIGVINLCCNTKSIVTRITSVLAVQSILQSSQRATRSATGSSSSSENASQPAWLCWYDGST